MFSQGARHGQLPALPSELHPSRNCLSGAHRTAAVLGWLVLDTEEESEVVQEMLDIMQAVGDLLYRRM